MILPLAGVDQVPIPLPFEVKTSPLLCAFKGKFTVVIDGAIAN